MIKYFLYRIRGQTGFAIETQITELREFAKKENLSIVAEFTESMSAKEPGRPCLMKCWQRLKKEKQMRLLLGTLTACKKFC